MSAPEQSLKRLNDEIDRLASRLAEVEAERDRWYSAAARRLTQGQDLAVRLNIAAAERDSWKERAEARLDTLRYVARVSRELTKALEPGE